MSVIYLEQHRISSVRHVLTALNIKFFSMCYREVSKTVPPYLSSLLHLCSSSCSLHSKGISRAMCFFPYWSCCMKQTPLLCTLCSNTSSQLNSKLHKPQTKLLKKIFISWSSSPLVANSSACHAVITVLHCFIHTLGK